MFEMTFNETTKNYVTVLEKGRPYWAPIKNDILTVPGRPGGFVTKKTKEAKRIPTTLLIHEAPGKDIKETLEEVAEWLVQEEAKKLVFSDEPDKYWLAEIDGAFDRDPKENPVRINVEFLCVDPHKYGLEQRKPFENGGITLVNDGTASSKPIFNIDVLQDTAFLQIAKANGEYMQIGNPADVDDVIVDPTPIVVDQNMSSFEGWNTDQVIAPRHGSIGGYFVTDNYLWRVTDFGSGKEWHGPARRFNLPRLLDDYWVEVLFRFQVYQSRSNRLGLLECDLIGSNNERIARMALKETSIHTRAVRADIHADGNGKRKHIMENETGYKRGSYNDFYGKMFIRKSNSYYFVQVGERQEDGTYANRTNARFVDYGGDFANTPLAAVQVRAAQWGDRMPVDHMAIHHVKVWEMQNTEASDIPIIAHEGDTIQLNHQNGSILINGEHEERLKNFGANYFSLDKGENRLFAFPEDYFDVEAIYQDRYL